MQEVLGITHVIARIDEGLALGVLVAHGCQSWHLCDEPVCRNHTMLRIIDVRRVMVERRQGAYNAAHDGHGVRVGAEALEKAVQDVLNDGLRTKDILSDGMKEISTSQMGDAIISKLQ